MATSSVTGHLSEGCKMEARGDGKRRNNVCAIEDEDLEL